MIYKIEKDKNLRCWIVWEVHRNYSIDRLHSKTKKEAKAWIQKITK